MQDIINSLKILLKHRRIKSNAEKKLFTVIVDDIFKNLSSKFSNLSYIKDEIFIDKTTTIEQEILDTKIILDKWLRYLLSDDVVDKIDLEELSKFSLEISYDIIYNILNSFTIEKTNELSEVKNVTIRNSKIPDKLNVISINDDSVLEHDIEEEIKLFLNNKKALFKK